MNLFIDHASLLRVHFNFEVDNHLPEERKKIVYQRVFMLQLRGLKTSPGDREEPYLRVVGVNVK